MSKDTYELIVVGAGPAGLQASIMSESERVDTLLIDCGQRLGGQAATTSRIENYGGFPDGVGGDELMNRMIDQASRFNTDFAGILRVVGFEQVEDHIQLRTDSDETYFSKFVLLTTGLENRTLRAHNLVAYLGRGASNNPPHQKSSYDDSEVYIVGGGNNAGQAAMHLAKPSSCKVHILIRGDSIDDKMSGYLVDEIDGKANIEVHTNTELVGVDGNGTLDKVTIKESGEIHDSPADQVFILIGSDPKTTWMPDKIVRDEKGFVVAGSDLSDEARVAFGELTKGRTPLGNETSVPGVFVAGDVRCGTIQRVVSAAADGANASAQMLRLRDIRSSKK